MWSVLARAQTAQKIQEYLFRQPSLEKATFRSKLGSGPSIEILVYTVCTKISMGPSNNESKVGEKHPRKID